jgi:hypothetical protein
MKRNSIFVFALYIAILCMPQYVEAQSAPVSPGYREEGNASWYGEEFSGRPTASGEIFNPSLFTAAHPTLPFGTFLIVTNKYNNRQVTVKVNDRGPFVASRIIDLSQAAAEHLDMINSGIAPVIIEPLSSTYAQPPEPPPVISAPAPVPPPEPTPVVSAPAPVPPPAPIQPPPPPPPAPQYLAPAPAPAPEPVRPPEPVHTPPVTQAPAESTPYPPITVNVYPSSQAQAQPQPPVQPQAQTQSQLYPQVPPQQQYQPQPQPQFQPQYQPQFQPQSQLYPQVPPPQPYPQVQPLPQIQPYSLPFQLANPYPAITALPPVESAPPPMGFKLIPDIKPLPGALYKLQVGSYKVPRYAVETFDKLKGIGLNPSYEQNGEFYRVVLARIPGIEVQSVAIKLEQAGFREALIREDR